MSRQYFTYIDFFDNKRIYLLIDNEIEEIRFLQNELNRSLKECFEHLTGYTGSKQVKLTIEYMDEAIEL